MPVPKDDSFFGALRLIKELPEAEAMITGAKGGLDTQADRRYKLAMSLTEIWPNECDLAIGKESQDIINNARAALK